MPRAYGGNTKGLRRIGGVNRLRLGSPIEVKGGLPIVVPREGLFCLVFIVDHGEAICRCNRCIRLESSSSGSDTVVYLLLRWSRGRKPGGSSRRRDRRSWSLPLLVICSPAGAQFEPHHPVAPRTTPVPTGTPPPLPSTRTVVRCRLIPVVSRTRSPRRSPHFTAVSLCQLDHKR
jgi:hypothetical protein